MKPLNLAPWMLVASAALLAGCAGGPYHARHHAPGAGADRYERQMETMQDMHRKMAAAKTPEERRALMDEHMKAMQGGMRMMCDVGAAPDATRRCAEMRDMTMMMMMEREPAAPARP
ncbi:hypothetical protein [Caldimonas sp. KR1-144]|uniref:hypothetical protein n=1 Tax=Caldimonas sp. KR1-144 TaxID=3400911 RepID=UPI003BFED05A